MKRRNRWLALFLSVGMLMSMPGVAYAEEDAIATSVSEVTEEIVSQEEAGSEETEEIVPEQAEADEIISAFAEEAAVEPGVTATDYGNGNVDLLLENYVKESDVQNVFFAVWSQKNGQDDLHWYVADNDLKFAMKTKDHSDDLGMYYCHVYAQMNDGAMVQICASTFDVNSIERDELTLSTEDLNRDEKKFRVILSNYEKPADIQEVRVAVWSQDKGQDDIVWYTLNTQADGTLSYDVTVAKHKGIGTIFAHAYALNKKGSLSFIDKSTFTVTAPSCTAVKAEKPDSEKGTCKINVEGLTCPSGITKVQIPIWSTSNQSDIKWYDAVKQSDGSYAVTMDITNHKFALGPYHIHVYATTGNGNTCYVGDTTVKFELGESSVTAEEKDGAYQLKALNIQCPGTISDVRFAVWSKVNGQDDLKWYTTSYSQAGRSAVYNMSMKDFTDFGEYFIHCYALMSTGSMVNIGNTTINLEPATVESVDVKTDNATGEFEITAKGLKDSRPISKVQVRVWSKSNKSDLVLYNATKDSAGNYVVKSNISKHSYNPGTYTAEVVVVENSGLAATVASKTFSIELEKSIVKVDNGTDETTYKATAAGVIIPGGVKNVQFAVWSKTNGQDDIKWYTASGTGGEYSATIKITNHKSSGLYYVHCYAENAAGSKTFVGSTEFTVSCSATTAISYEDSTTNDGFTVTFSITGATSPITKVRVPVWTRSDQSDINWYAASLTSNGAGNYTASVRVNVGNHKMNSGKYNVHTYATFKNGIETYIGGSDHTYNPSCMIGVSNTGSGKRLVTLKNVSSTATKVQFPVWSDDKGQDDIYWYTAKKQSDGSWTATVNSANHKSAGNYQVHCYVDGAMVARTTLNFASSEMAKNGWYYENGYKFYYVNGKKQTNVSGIIGAQGSYVAKVNRTTCTVTIYANDPNSSKGYIVPVIAFTCSVGLPGTPTTAGTHYTFAKYRWKELMGPSYGQYATKFTSDGIYFHSVAGINTTSYNLNSIDYNNLGIPASHGCVRLCVRDAKWIYDNCPLGMKVIVYDSGDPGPFGKPATIKIPAGQTWDPTDPNVR